LGRAAVQTLTSGGSDAAIEAFGQRKTGIWLTHRVIALAIPTGDMSLQANFMSRLTLIGEQGQKAFMYGWCAGPAGIGLGRLAQFGGGTPEVREGIQAAVGDATAGPNSRQAICAVADAAESSCFSRQQITMAI
jgi:hypothetical protein